MLFSVCGSRGSRTPDPLLVRQTLNQLSYAPLFQCAIMANCCVICGTVTQSRSKVRSFIPNLDALHFTILPHFKFIFPAIIASYFAHRSVMYSCTLLSSSSYSLFLPKINFAHRSVMYSCTLLSSSSYSLFLPKINFERFIFLHFSNTG